MNSMSRKLLLAALTGFFASSLPPNGAAQCPPAPPVSPLAEGEIGLFFDPLGTETCGNIAPFGYLYVVARVPAGGVAQFVIPQLLPLTLPPGIQIASGGGLPSGGPYEILIVVDGCGVARRTDPLTCPVAQGDLLVISTIAVMAIVPVTGSACFTTVCPTFAGTVAMPPSYARCDTGSGGEFTGGAAMCVGFGQAPVATEPITWGAVKALYD